MWSSVIDRINEYHVKLWFNICFEIILPNVFSLKTFSYWINNSLKYDCGLKPSYQIELLTYETTAATTGPTKDIVITRIVRNQYTKWPREFCSEIKNIVTKQNIIFFYSIVIKTV